MVEVCTYSETDILSKDKQNQTKPNKNLIFVT